MMPGTLRASIAAALIAAAALAGCGGGGGGKDDKGAKAPPPSGPQSGQATISIANFAFTPQPLVVKPGTKVTWTNNDTSIHDIKDTSPLATPVSQSLSKGDTFAITYGQPGTYKYECGIHPYMSGSVEVAP